MAKCVLNWCTKWSKWECTWTRTQF